MSVSFDKNKIKIVLLENVSPTARALFEKAGYTNIVEIPKALEGDELMAIAPDVRILGIRSTTYLKPEFFDKAEKLISVGCFCIGTNQVDLPYAAKRNVAVFNAPFSNTRSVAELAMSSIVSLMRRIPEKNAAMHRGVWDKSATRSNEVRFKTLGIVGYGAIGTQLSVLAESFGMHVNYYDAEKKLPVGNARSMNTLEEVLRSSDVISLHVPDIPQTRNLLNAEKIAIMKDGACVINYSRGSVVDIEALAAALKSGKLRGAAIDVYPKEPKSKQEEFVSALRGVDSALLTPHVGGSTVEAQEMIGEEVAEKLIRYIDNGSTTGAVNFPNVTLPQHPGAYRILNIHENKPGVLTAINSELAKAGANIVGQYLQTNPTTGYVVIDIEMKGDPETFRSILKAIPGTLKTRILH